MGVSQSLTLVQIRAVFRLLGEVCELGAWPLVWRRHMLEGLRHMVGADVCHAGEAPIPCSPADPEFLGMVIDGVSEPRLLDVYNMLIHERDYSDDPCIEAVGQLITQSFTRTRQQLAADRLWYRRRDLDAWRTLGADNFIYSHQFLGQRGCIHLIAVNRAWGKPSFSERDRRIVELFHEELGRLWHRQSDDPRLKLPPRLRQTLDFLMEGAAEKEIAETIRISRHTVHDYVKELYQRFDVRSHAQLLVRLARARAVLAPRLSIESGYRKSEDRLLGLMPRSPEAHA